MKNKNIKYYKHVHWYHPFNVVIKKGGEDDLYNGVTYGLDLDLNTVITYCNYEYGKIFTFRILGFGFEYGLIEI